MNSNRNPSTLFVADIQQFIKMKDFWDREIQEHVDDPLLFSSMIIEQWKCSLKIGDHPFLLIVKKEERISVLKMFHKAISMHGIGDQLSF